MITCSKCGKENQDHYKFCLGCGAELPRDAAPKPFAPRTPPHGMKAAAAMRPVSVPSPAAPPATAGGSAPIRRPSSGVLPAQPDPAPMSSPAPMPRAPEPSTPPSGDTVTCPQCSHVNSTAFKFCASCGFNLSKVAASAPQPAALSPMSSPASIPEPAAHPVSGWKLTVLRADGSDAGTFEVPNEPTVVGREIGGIFGGDSYLSPRHALLFRRGGRLAVEDAGSLNGTYMRLKRDVSEKLSDGQMFRIGQEIIRFERLSPEPARDGVELMGSPSTGYVGRIVLVTGREATGNAFPVPQTGVHIGRERGHVLFPEDGYVSGLHCAITCDGNDVLLTDLGSSNGTFIRLVDERDVLEGDVILMGQQLFRAGK